MIGTIQRKINRTKEDKDMLLYSQKLEDLYKYKNMDAFHTRKKSKNVTYIGRVQ